MQNGIESAQLVLFHARGQRGHEHPVSCRVFNEIEVVLRNHPEYGIDAFRVACLGDRRLVNADGIRRVYLKDGRNTDGLIWKVRPISAEEGLVASADPKAEVVLIARWLAERKSFAVAEAIAEHFSVGMCRLRASMSTAPIERVSLPDIGHQLFGREHLRRPSHAQRVSPARR